MTSEIPTDNGFQKSFLCCAKICNEPGSETQMKAYQASSRI